MFGDGIVFFLKYFTLKSTLDFAEQTQLDIGNTKKSSVKKIPKFAVYIVERKKGKYLPGILCTTLREL